MNTTNEITDKQIQCPHCKLMNCYETNYNSIITYLCFTCGYTTNSKMIVGSNYVKEYFIESKTVAKFIKDIHFIDNERNLVWYPGVLQFPMNCIIFPEPTDDGTDWNWVYVQEVPILEEEKEKYKIDGTDEYYKTKLDMNTAKRYNKYDFYTACVDAAIIIPPKEIIN